MNPVAPAQSKTIPPLRPPSQIPAPSKGLVTTASAAPHRTSQRCSETFAELVLCCVFCRVLAIVVDVFEGRFQGCQQQHQGRPPL